MRQKMVCPAVEADSWRLTHLSTSCAITGYIRDPNQELEPPAVVDPWNVRPGGTPSGRAHQQFALKRRGDERRTATRVWKS